MDISIMVSMHQPALTRVLLALEEEVVVVRALALVSVPRLDVAVLQALLLAGGAVHAAE